MNRSIRKRLVYGAIAVVMGGGAAGGWAVASATGESADNVHDLVHQGLDPLSARLADISALSGLARNVPLSPVSAIGAEGLNLTDAVSKALDEVVQTSDLTTATSFDDLVNKLNSRSVTVGGVTINLGCAGGGTCTPVTGTSGPDTGTLTIPIHLSRSINAPLANAIFGTNAISGTAPVTLSFDTTPVINFDYSKLSTGDTTGISLASPLTATLSAALSGGSHSFTTSLGFTDVSGDINVSSGTLSLALTLTDPDGAGGTTLDELTTNDLRDLVSINPSGALNAVAHLDTTLTPTNPDITLTWSNASLTTANLPAPTVSGPGLDMFTRTSPDAVFNGIAQLGNSLQAFQANGDLHLPFLTDGLGALSKFTDPVFQFIAANGVVCASGETNVPDGNPFNVATLIYCQSTAAGGVRTGSVHWHANSGVVLADHDPAHGNLASDKTNNASGADADGTVAPIISGQDNTGPTKRAVFYVTDPANINITVDYDQCDDATCSHAASSDVHKTAGQAPKTAAQLAQRLATAGLGADAASILSYDPSTQALTFHLHKVISTPKTGHTSFDAGDRLGDVGILDLGNLAGGAVQATLDYSVSGIALDMTFGVLLTEDIDDINPSGNDSYPSTLPAGQVDRFFIQTPSDHHVLSLDTADVHGEAALDGRIGFLGVHVGTPAGTTSFISKPDASKPLLGVDVTLPGFDVVPAGGGSAVTIPNAVQLRNLGTLNLLPDHGVVDPVVNAALHLPLTASASVAGAPFKSADNTVASVQINADVPDASLVLTDPDHAVHVVVAPGQQANFDALFGGFANIGGPNNPTEMLNLITALLDQLTNAFSGTGIADLNAQLPVIGKSPRELLVTINCLQYAVHQIVANSSSGGTPPTGCSPSVPPGSTIGTQLPATLQDFLHAVENELGLPADTLHVRLADNVDVGGTTHRSLVLLMDMSDSTSGSAPLAISLGSAGSLASVQGSSPVDYTGAYDIAIHPGVTLDEATPQTFLLSDSHINLDATADAHNNVDFTASIGPLSVLLGHNATPDDSTDPKGELKAHVGINLGYPSGNDHTAAAHLTDLAFLTPDTDTVDCGDANGDHLVGIACLNVSAALNGDYLGNLGVYFTDLTSPHPSVPADLAAQIASAALDPTVLLQAFTHLVDQLATALQGAGNNFKVPVIGGALDAGADIAGALHDHVLTPLNSALQTLDTANTKTLHDTLQQKVFEALGPSGADLLRHNRTSEDDGVLGDVNVVVTCGGSDCSGDTSKHLVDITDLRVKAPIGQGIVDGADACNTKTGSDQNVTGCQSGDVQHFDAGLDGLPIHISGAIRPHVGWRVNIDVGINRTDGPYVGKSNDTDHPLVELGVGVGLGPDSGSCNAADPVNIPGAPAALNGFSNDRCLHGQLGFLNVVARDGDTPSDDLKKPSEVAATTKLGFGASGPGDTINVGNITSILPAVQVNGHAHVNLRLRTLVGDDGTGLPSVLGAFHAKVPDLSWSTDHPAQLPNFPTLSFDGLTLDAGAFFTQTLGPIVHDIQKITSPLKPIIDTLQAPLPVLTQLAALVGKPPVTLLSIIELASGQDLSLVNSVLSLIKFANELPADPGALLIPLDGAGPSANGGSVAIQPDKARNGGLTPTNAGQILGDLSDFAPESGGGILGSIPGSNNSTQRVNTGQNPAGDTRPTTFGVKGLDFPFLTHPANLAKLIVGQDIDIVTYDAGTLRASASTQVDFGPFFIGPVPVTVFIGGGVTVEGRFAMGYDTSGFREVLNGAPGTALLDGIFLSDWNTAGQDVPEITLIGDVFAGAEVDIVIAAAGVKGGITLTVDLNLNDDVEDGKMHFSEIVNKLANPICLFDVHGSLDAYLKFFLKINLFLFSADFEFPILNVHLLDFNLGCSGADPPQLAHLAGDGTLTLNMGPRRTDRNVAEDEKNETFTVTQIKGGSGNAVEIKAFGITQQYGSGVGDQPSITKLVANGTSGDIGDGDDVIKLLPGGTPGTTSTTEADRSTQIPFTIPANTIVTGSGNDQIVTGDGADVVTSGGGNDRVSLSGGDDIVHAGAGNDTVDGGQGSDHIFGEGDNDALHGDPDADLIDGGTGADNIDGGPAPKTGTGQDGANVLIGGGGGDTVTGGPGNDAIVLTTPPGAVNENGGVAAAHTAIENAVNPSCPADALFTTTETGGAFGGAGDDVIIGDNGPDNLVGNGGNDIICALKGDDTTLGDNQPGDPAVAGNAPGTDRIDDGGGKDQTLAGGEADLVLGRGGSDVLRGEGGNDRVIGGSGMDIADGGSGADRILGDDGTIDADPGSDPVASMHSDATTDVNELNNPTCARDGKGFATDSSFGLGDCLTGGDGNDVIFGGGGKDRVNGDANDDYIDGGHGEDNLRGGSDADTIFGRGENDTAYGDAGNDLILGNGEDDHLLGLTGDDDVFGNAGTDVITGDGGQDDLVGGSDTAGAADGPDTINGGEDVDFIAGDNASFTRVFTSPGVPTLDTSTDSSNKRTVSLLANDPSDTDDGDHLFGDNGNDRIWGEQDEDTVGGGGNNDVIFGNEAADGIHGDTGDDHIVGGSADENASDDGDTIHGDDGADLILGDNGVIDWNGTIHLGATGISGASGQDIVNGDNGDDIIHGQDADDTLHGDANNDRMYGELGGDTMTGDTGADYMLGDQGTITPPAPPAPSVITFTGTPIYDVELLHANDGGEDVMDGGTSDDHMWGGWESDDMSGGTGDDYMEGNAANDTIYGLSATFDVAPNIDELLGVGLGDDDDIIGGSSSDNPETIKLDTGETLIQGNAGQDFILGDNGEITRTPNADSTAWVQDVVMTSAKRGYTLYDTEKTGADLAAVSGGDVVQGNSGNDRVFAEGGDDTVNGNTGTDVLVGNQDSDHVYGDAGEDDIVGGSLEAGQPDKGDFLYGGTEQDVITGDNATIERVLTPEGNAWTLDELPSFGHKRVITKLDTEKRGAALLPVSGNDLIHGDEQNDKLYGQAGNDTVKGNDDDDYIEGNQDNDLVEGNFGADDIIGGSPVAGQPDDSDVIHGGGGDDVAVGDNGVIVRIPPASINDPDYYYVTYQLGTTAKRGIKLLDIDSTDASVAGTDQVSGGSQVDVLFGQGERDYVMGGGQDDYLEGNGGSDFVFGDLVRADVASSPTPEMVQQNAQLPPLPANLPEGESGEPQLSGNSMVHGQDDILGGNSKAGLGDTGDFLYGNAQPDYMLGDNGTIQRTIVNGAYVVYALRYGPLNTSADPAALALVRVPRPGNPSTRFCVTRAAGTCEVSSAFGGDFMDGDGGDDTMYGQDGNDTMKGGAQDDDMYGELGADMMFGDAGDDAMLGDRGGIVDRYENGSRSFTFDMNSVPQIHYEAFLNGSVTRVTDMQHDVSADTFTGADGQLAGGATNPMVYDGVQFGANDQMHGGDGHDSMHGGVGEDLMNGDSGGDTAYGDDGSDLIWGGRGNPDTAGDPAARGTKDAFVDYLFGGKGGNPTNGVVGADVLDWHPRGTFTMDATKVNKAGFCTTNQWPMDLGSGKNVSTIDPCVWFQMTYNDDDVPGDPSTFLNNQHHQGIDWMYGGWDRDVTQGDVADNGPNLGDRLLDWTGAYNLYTHCNAAYGGYNDLRQWSPEMQSFLQQWGLSTGAGQGSRATNGTVSGDIVTPKTSAYVELALVYQADVRDHGNGKDFPTTPGHFDNPNACAP